MPVFSYPFSGIVGLEDLKLCLLLNAIDSSIGGVLVSGEKGAGKTTTVRAVAQLLGKRTPFVNLPLGVTEDRLLGGLALEPLLKEQKKRLEKGLLAEADGGFLYIDEVNLMEDHLANLLLDAASSRGYHLERDGLSVWCESAFCLVGSMNPEEGELRPQLTDRFGLSIQVSASTNPDERAEIIKRRMLFAQNPRHFYREEETQLRKRLREAQKTLAKVEVPDSGLHHVVELCLKHEVKSLRADLVITKASRAYAAWCGRSLVKREDIDKVAPFVLHHRRPQEEPHAPSTSQQNRPDESMRQHAVSRGRDEQGGESNTLSNASLPPAHGEKKELPHGSNAQKGGSTRPETLLSGQKRHLYFSSLQTPPVPNQPKVSSQRGTATASWTQSKSRLDLIKTVKHFLLFRELRRFFVRRLGLVRVIFLIDQSGSMGKAQQLAKLKGWLMSCVRAHRRETIQYALVGMHRGTATIWQPFSTSVKGALRLLSSLRQGGRTNLLAAFEEIKHGLLAHKTASRHRTTLFLFTDGHINSGAAQPVEASSTFYREHLKKNIKGTLIDTENSFVSTGCGQVLAEKTGMRYVKW